MNDKPGTMNICGICELPLDNHCFLHGNGVVICPRRGHVACSEGHVK